MELHQVRDDTIGLEVVGSDGRPIVCRPIDVNELIQNQGSSIELGNGVRVRLEEYSEENDEEEEEEEEEFTESDSDNEDDEYYNDDEYEESKSDNINYNINNSDQIHVPPGYHGLTHWNDALHAMQSEGKGDRNEIDIHRKNNKSRSNSNNSYTNKGIWNDVVNIHRSRRDYWASFAPPIDSERNYKRLDYVSLMPNTNSRRFRLPPLMYHASTSYLNTSDQGQRILIYGGTTNIGKTIENELYEFSLLTGNWKRIEGKNFISPGNYGHTTIVVDILNRLVVIGGIGPGGQPPPTGNISDNSCLIRRKLLFPCKENIKIKRNPFTKTEIINSNSPPDLWSLMNVVEEAPMIGFLPMIFDMDLKTHKWRAIQTIPEIPVSFHTSIINNGNIYIFGGITNQLLVSSQLIMIDTQTYKVSLISPDKSNTPKARYLHSAVVYGHFMIIYGGFDIQNEALNDTWAFDLINESWEKLDCHGAPTRAGHSACIVGSRLIIVGGFDNNISSEQIPGNNIFELQLIPTNDGVYLWKEILIKPSLPPLAFSTACACVDDASFIIYGGCTLAGKKEIKMKKQKQKQQQQQQQQQQKQPICKKIVTRKFPNVTDDYNKNNNEEYEDDNDDYNNFWQKLIPFNDGFAFTFLFKKNKKTLYNQDHDNSTPYINNLGVVVDPDEVPPEFQAFVKRQQDFILKKNSTIAEKMKKISLDELENMDPQLYLTSEEIELLLNKSNELCEKFTEFKMENLPYNTPDRDSRIHINEECISLSRQIRDVVKSMKGHTLALTEVKSKSHRKKSGQKFEDHSVAKPFRRVIIMSLIKNIKNYLKRLHTMNKAFKTIEWPEKGEYLEAVKNMQENLDNFIQTVKNILEKYIEKRVESLMTAVSKRKDNMKRLTEIVEKNRNDKIFQTDKPDPQRERVKQMWNKGEIEENKKEILKSSSTSHHNHRHRSRSIGGGFYKDESKAVISLQPKELHNLLKKVFIVKKTAISFSDYCHSTISHVEKQNNIQSNSINVESPLHPSSSPPPNNNNNNNNNVGYENYSLNPPIPPIISTVQSSSIIPNNSSSSPSNGKIEEIGEASPIEIVIQHSDNIRKIGIEYADKIRECVSAFAKEFENQSTLENNTSDTPINVNEESNKPILLHLSSLRSLVLCKDKLDELKEKIPGIRLNKWLTDDLAGAPQDNEAQKRFELMFKSLSSLIQRIKMSFLSKSGARPARTVYTRQKPVILTNSTPNIKKPRQILKVISISNISEQIQVKESSNINIQQQQQQQQQPSITFEPLSTPIAPIDISTSNISNTIPTEPKPISLTSGEAMSLAPSFPNITPISNSGVIIPSCKDIKVIPNTKTDPTSWIDNKINISDTNEITPQSTRIAISQGPQITSKLTTTTTTTTTTKIPGELSSFQDSLSITQTQQNLDIEKKYSRDMVSFTPGFFQMGAVPQVSIENKNKISPYRNALELEDDYFFFGRSLVPEEAATNNNNNNNNNNIDVAQMDINISKFNTVRESPNIMRNDRIENFPITTTSTRNIKISPPVGTPATAVFKPKIKTKTKITSNTSAAYTSPIAAARDNNNNNNNNNGPFQFGESRVQPIESFTKSPYHNSDVVNEIPTRRGEMFRGKLTPGELQILQARERLRTSSSSLKSKKKTSAVS